MIYYDFLQKKNSAQIIFERCFESDCITFFPKSEDFNFYENFEKSQISVANPS